MIALVISLFVYNFPDEPPPKNQNSPVAQPSTRPPVTTPSPEPVLFSRGSRRVLGVLNEDVFFQHASGKEINNEEDLKEVVTSFLFELSPEIRTVYRSKNELWNAIMDLNPQSRRKITSYLKNVPFTIERNGDQLEMLRGLVVFSKQV